MWNFSCKNFPFFLFLLFDYRLAHSLNLDATKIGQRPDTRVHVKQMKCSTKLMDLFWIMYQVLEEEDDYLIFQGRFIPKSMFDKLRDTNRENERYRNF
jgi:hypothetical protein